MHALVKLFLSITKALLVVSFCTSPHLSHRFGVNLFLLHWDGWMGVSSISSDLFSYVVQTSHRQQSQGSKESVWKMKYHVSPKMCLCWLTCEQGHCHDAQFNCWCTTSNGDVGAQCHVGIARLFCRIIHTLPIDIQTSSKSYLIDTHMQMVSSKWDVDIYLERGNLQSIASTFEIIIQIIRLISIYTWLS